MKSILKLFLVSISFLLIIMKVDALSVSSSDLTLNQNESKNIELFANTDIPITKISFTMVYSTYDIPADFIVNNTYKDLTSGGSRHTIDLNGEQEGKIFLGNIKVRVVNNPSDKSGNINISKVVGTTESGESIDLNSLNIVVKVNEQIPQVSQVSNNDKDENPLKEIKSNIVKINLEENVYDYQIKINSSIEELDLEPITKNENYLVEISSQKISELVDNKINITITDSSKNETLYTIKVNIMDEPQEIAIDNNDFKVNNTYKNKWIILISILSVALILVIVFRKKVK